MKYEEIYLKAYEPIPEAKDSLAKNFHFANQAQDRRAPGEAYATAPRDLAA